MKVVVRAKVNATTDLASLTASLTAQRDAKLRPLRCLEIKVLKDLAPQLDEALQVEQEAIDAALEAEIIEEEVESQVHAGTGTSSFRTLAIRVGRP